MKMVASTFIFNILFPIIIFYINFIFKNKCDFIKKHFYLIIIYIINIIFYSFFENKDNLQYFIFVIDILFFIIQSFFWIKRKEVFVDNIILLVYIFLFDIVFKIYTNYFTIMFFLLIIYIFTIYNLIILIINIVNFIKRKKFNRLH